MKRIDVPSLLYNLSIVSSRPAGRDGQSRIVQHLRAFFSSIGDGAFVIQGGNGVEAKLNNKSNDVSLILECVAFLRERIAAGEALARVWVKKHGPKVVVILISAQGKQPKFIGVSMSAAYLDSVVVGEELQEFYESDVFLVLWALESACDKFAEYLSFLPSQFRAAIWNSVDVSGKEVRLPWSAEDDSATDTSHQTITLALDLRRSTLMMNEARDRRHHAQWIDALVKILRRISHDNLGIFDKFTGDGVITHFLGDEIAAMRQIDRSLERESALPAVSAVAAVDKKQRGSLYALRAAVEMTLAVQTHLQHAIPNLRYTTPQFGAAVGLAVDNANWSVDRDGRPIVVGSGVVNACRLSGGQAGEILMPNDFKYVLAAADESLEFDEIALGGRHKEYQDSLGVVCWRLRGQGRTLGRPIEEIVRIVEDAWADSADKAR